MWVSNPLHATHDSLDYLEVKRKIPKSCQFNYVDQYDYGYGMHKFRHLCYL